MFSTPEIGTVGLPEHMARERYAKVDIYKASFRPLKNTVSGRDERTLMKLVVDARQPIASSAATCSGPTPPRSCRWRPSPCT